MKELKGWKGIGPERGKFIPAEDGLDHILTEFGITGLDESVPLYGELKELLIDWYYSGNWIEVYEDG